MHLEARPPEELTEKEREDARAAAEVHAKKLWGQFAQAVESPDLEERVKGYRCQVGIFRLVRHERKGFRSADQATFVCLGRGESWVKAFADAADLKKKIEERLGDRGIAKANEVYRLDVPLVKRVPARIRKVKR